MIHQGQREGAPLGQIEKFPSLCLAADGSLIGMTMLVMDDLHKFDDPGGQGRFDFDGGHHGIGNQNADSRRFNLF